MRVCKKRKMWISNGGFARSYSAARKDWTVLMETRELKPNVPHLVLIGEPIIRGVLQYILGSDNVQLLSWGSRRIRKEKEWSYFPKVDRKISVQMIWKNLKRTCRKAHLIKMAVW